VLGHLIAWVVGRTLCRDFALKQAEYRQVCADLYGDHA
jgi:hypothetical protein